jgi:hypothetical protein
MNPVNQDVAGGGAAHDLLSVSDDANFSGDDDMTTWTRSRIERLVTQMQSAFLDNPSLSLTLSGARRRFGVDDVACAAVLGALVDAGVLTERDGVYRRHFPRPAVRPAA